MKLSIKKCLPVIIMCSLLCSFDLYGGEADVIAVDIDIQQSDLYNFTVTIKHDDEGWDHYVDKWEIIDANGNVIGTRILHHPHVDEQPFSRSLSGVKIPEHIKIITVRAYDSVHEYGGKVITREIP